MSIITSTHRPYITVLREKSDKDGPEKGGKCDTEKDISYYLESRQWAIIDIMITILETWIDAW
jgi:hypothetical protein